MKFKMDFSKNYFYFLFWRTSLFNLFTKHLAAILLINNILFASEIIQF